VNQIVRPATGMKPPTSTEVVDHDPPLLPQSDIDTIRGQIVVCMLGVLFGYLHGTMMGENRHGTY
jgi:hypothetical protein